MLVGESACLSAAMLWAVAVVVFRGPIAAWGARSVNLFKCLFATVALAFTALLVGGFTSLAFAPPRALWLLALSGVVGLTFGDTALFAAVGRIGAHRTLLLQTLAPVFAGLLAAILGERLSATQLTGGAVVLAGTAMVVGADARGFRSASRVNSIGLGVAVFAALGQGVGVVIAKAGIEAVPVVAATLVRLAAGSVGMLVVTAGAGTLTRLARAVREPAMLRRAGLATLLGTYAAMLLAMLGLALAPATVAAVLLSTTPIFALAVEAVVDGQQPSVAAVIGTAVAVSGVVVLTVG
ncbi:MAG: DMT family transporter [Thermoanaerobaculales bacterium]